MGQPAARKTDGVAHILAEAGPIMEGSSNVIIGHLAAARLGDKVQHKSAMETITEGEPSVKINGKPAARMGDKVACNGIIVGGCGSVHIGRDKDEACLIAAADSGAMIVEPE
jgi:uncharacterized Zn-binding protein involved in type VI secretion